ncbi:metal ABC transporter permease [Corynebacterium canis]|uniref:Metal ABC transporter permease n=1 Tax=Corynebacterium canis TaxID=679663 RepID=A0A5C5UTR5_9CORY|nr:metal ABC transporter permease [Corynebacterium canis]TWT28962.1 metal ABC transporter permease [Corynebacterium canis]WJY75184.1 Manganese transport system membrane protein MntB [Corynebacterium canis]
MSFAVSVSILALVVALTCALPGVVLVLRRQAMLSDALSHAVLPGIAIAAMWVSSPRSPWLIVGATIGGVVVIAATEWLRSHGRFTEDSATGLIFPAFFAIGVIIISTRLTTSTISEHTVLVGDLNIAALSHLVIGGIDLGPKDAWIVGSVGLLTAIVIIVAHRPLTISTFDPVFAASIGLKQRLLHYVIMVLVSLTVVVSFNAAGAVLVVALMIVPAATALLVTHSLGELLSLTMLIALASSQIGFWVAYRLDAATSPTMALVYGLIFLGLWGFTRIRARRAGATEVSKAAEPASLT